MRILLGISGGLDSAYAALKLKNEGHVVEGAILVMHDYTELSAARQAAESLGIPLHEVDCRERFENIVVDNFIKEYKRARTPNPCVICNSEVKFLCLYEYAMKEGFDAIATGHYGSVVAKKSNGEFLENTASTIHSLSREQGVRYAVKRGTDRAKDQSYMLWRLSQKVLSKLILPLSSDVKADIKVKAAEYGLDVVNREESQEICFIPDNDYASFIESRTEPSLHGEFVDENGKVLGEHKGIIRYTLGQRRGLGISAASRIFVTDIDVENNRITLSPYDKLTSELSVSSLVFSAIEKPLDGEELELSVKLRYAQPPAPCRVKIYGDVAKVVLQTPQRAVTPGQSAVFYDGETVCFGGFID